MYMNKFLKFLGLIGLLAGCATTAPDGTWSDGYDTTQVGQPINMQYGRPMDEYGTLASDDATPHRIAVLLPTSGKNSQIGKSIQTSITTAALEHNMPNLSVAFYDTAGDATTAIRDALATNPEIIIGPVFAENARILRDTKPENIPALSFTSDATAVGNGVMTMALMPTNSVETIVSQMSADGVKSFIILSPNTTSGKLMAAAATNAADIYNVPVGGLFYYDEGNANSIKDTSKTASMNTARAAANIRAREILSDILSNERLTALEYSNLNMQLEKISRTDTLGPVPYDAILFLGNADDTKKLASFMRYYGVSSRDAAHYGTAMWDGTDIAGDLTLTGAKYASLPTTSETFSTTYTSVTGNAPSRLATFGYDATNMAIGMLKSDKTDAAYLLDPSGYIGTDGLFRLKPNGDNERALRIVKLNGDGTTTDIKTAPTNFIRPIYNIEPRRITPAEPFNLKTRGINPNDYIRIPERLMEKYKSQTYGANMTAEPAPQPTNVVTVVPTDESAPVRVSEYTPVKLESVNRKYIDEIEIEE